MTIPSAPSALSTDNHEDASRLESLWSGTFGDAYTERNKDTGKGRENFWHRFLKEYHVKNVLEVGCNVGVNLQCMLPFIKETDMFGVDVNTEALSILKEKFPLVNALRASARTLPFPDASFDLVFTAGVLIHQPTESLGDVMKEMVRCSRKYVLCMEYFAEETEEVPYRNQKGALFKRNYGKLFQAFPLTLLKQDYLGPEEGWDRVTWWLFQK
ncbi:MAG: pseudaminic acid biosynthesis-associated methylase [Candidatus Peregrinibacteria bacterium]